MTQHLDRTLEHFLATGEVLHVAADGQMRVAHAGRRSPAQVLLPGSFNPVHRGHWQLARIAESILGMPVAFELSVVNVDKPSLDSAAIRTRLAQFHWQASVWLTRSARFVEKAESFPGAVFVVGADTALRVVSAKYYDGGMADMHARLSRITDLGCRFLVACRADAQGQCWRKGDLPIPPDFVDLFEEIPPEQFRRDISSTSLRGAIS